MIAGVDGCKGGWVVAVAGQWPPLGTPELRLVPTFDEVLFVTADCAFVAVDMPIGLPCGAAVRECDRLARAYLAQHAPPGVKSAGARVFDAPPREALPAATPTEFQDVHKRLRGVGAGIPLWGLVPKLLEVDAAMTPELQKRVFEAHPELCFARLAGGTLPSKHTKDGLARRRDILCAHNCTLSSKPLSSGTTKARPDDVLDALACLAAAHNRLMPAQGTAANRLPPDMPPTDERGLRMEIWY